MLRTSSFKVVLFVFIVLVLGTATALITARLLHRPRSVTAIAFGKDNTIFAGCQKGHIALWNSRSSQLLELVTAHSRPVSALAVSPDGRLIASGSGDGRLRLWRASALTPVHSIETKFNFLSAVAFIDNGAHLVSVGYANHNGHDNATVEIWRVNDGSRVHSVDRNSRDVAFLTAVPTGRHFITAGWSNEVTIWNFDRIVHTITLEGLHAPLSAMAISPDGDLLAAGDEKGALRVFDAHQVRPRYSLHPAHRMYNAVAFSADSSMIVASDAAGQLVLWNLNDFTDPKIIRGPWNFASSVLFSSDGRTCAAWVHGKQYVHTGIHVIDIQSEKKCLIKWLQ